MTHNSLNSISSSQRARRQDRRWSLSSLYSQPMAFHAGSSYCYLLGRELNSSLTDGQKHFVITVCPVGDG